MVLYVHDVILFMEREIINDPKLYREFRPKRKVRAIKKSWRRLLKPAALPVMSMGSRAKVSSSLWTRVVCSVWSAMAGRVFESGLSGAPADDTQSHDVGYAYRDMSVSVQGIAT